VDEYSPRTHDGDVNYDYERIIVGRYISIGDFINTGR